MTPLAELAASTTRAYNRIRLVIFGTVFAFPLTVGFVLFSIAALIGFDRWDAFVFAISASMLALPLMAVLVNPILSSSLALLYFRARQARGEAVNLGAVMSSRL